MFDETVRGYSICSLPESEGSKIITPTENELIFMKFSTQACIYEYIRAINVYQCFKYFATIRYWKQIIIEQEFIVRTPISVE